MVAALRRFMIMRILIFAIIVVFCIPDEGSAARLITAEDVQANLNIVWITLAAILVFLMKAGFAMVEIGFTRSKNAVNALMKNFVDFSISAVTFWAIGFGLMFGTSNGIFGTDGFYLQDYTKNLDPWLFAFWMYQVVFVSSTAAIVSGAMAERTRFAAGLIFTILLTAFIYPVFGSWAWGGLYHGSGWLERLGFIDFAGSTVIHSIGGWAGLAGTIVLGPRLGKFREKGVMQPIPGHNLPLAALGTLILWFGWYGFNAGNTLEGNERIGLIIINTTLSGAGGALAGMITAWLTTGKPDAGMTLNGALAGLVGITAGCAYVSPFWSIVIGVVSGILVVFSVGFFDRLKIDDPVGAISVHGVCGVWGTLAVGLFKTGELFNLRNIAVQFLGCVAAFFWSFFLAYAFFKLISYFLTLRVSVEEEFHGLDFSEHAAAAYPDFHVTSIK